MVMKLPLFIPYTCVECGGEFKVEEVVRTIGPKGTAFRCLGEAGCFKAYCERKRMDTPTTTKAVKEESEVFEGDFTEIDIFILERLVLRPLDNTTIFIEPRLGGSLIKATKPQIEGLRARVKQMAEDLRAKELATRRISKPDFTEVMNYAGEFCG